MWRFGCSNCADVHKAFAEHQVFRIDHYLGKETAQNTLFLRFANTGFEPVWNRRYVSDVQITVAEAVDVGHRAGYYGDGAAGGQQVLDGLTQINEITAQVKTGSEEMQTGSSTMYVLCPPPLTKDEMPPIDEYGPLEEQD